MLQTDNPRIVIDRLIRVTNAHDIEGLVACFADDYVLEAPAHPAQSFRGTNQVRRNWTRFFALIPNIELRLVRLAVDPAEDSVWTELEMTGTRSDGAAHLIRGVFIFGVKEDRIRWGRMFLEPVVDAGGAP